MPPCCVGPLPPPILREWDASGRHCPWLPTTPTRHHGAAFGNVLPGHTNALVVSDDELAFQRSWPPQKGALELAKLPPETARSTQSMHSTAPHSGNDNSDADGSYAEDGDVWVDIPNDGEFTLHELQGLELSYEGGELESLVADWKNVAKSHCRRKQVPGNIVHWQMQASKCREDCYIQLPLLYEVYMVFKYGSDATQADISDAGNIAGGIQMEQGLDKFTIAVLGLQGYNAVCSLAHNKCEHTFLNQTLILHGFLGTSPIMPSLAFHLKDLEIYRRCCLRCPQFSLQQWVKVICDLSNINYKHTYQMQFSDVFDIYLKLHRHMEQSINESLGRGAPDWRIKHSCPACLYQLADEPTLSPSVIGAIDGNNSLKHFNNKAQTQDTLTFESDYFLSWNFVNGLARDMRVIQKRCKGNDIKEVCEEGDPTDGNPAIVVCTDQWKVTNADKMKILLNSFDETGVFIAACHHGIVWIISDMVKSGELAKYPLAACAYILEHLPSDLGIGYYIGCSFRTTLANSSLGVKARERSLNFVVPAFHEREIPHTQFMEWLNEEHVYLKSKASEPKEDISHIEYVELLKKYDTARMLAEQARKIESDTKQPAQKMWLTCVAWEAWEAWEAVLILQREIQSIEEQLDISERWTAATEQYQAVLKYMDKQVFQLAVDKLEGLVVQHLFELTKANISETGYKLRNQIAKAIKTRSKAIQRTLNTYNNLATKMDPPCPKLTWAEIIEYNTIAEFELLQIGAWEDIQNLEWAKTQNHEATQCHLEILQAEEEIQRLNVEVICLATWIEDEIKVFSVTLD
ncbi:hypothetical protein BU17DRAFT_87722 [Hysterangium stoloniferum]|nr:hypothetical protein BU17DRAFT_87722 [Hysterangium stoloniferum]